MLHLLTINPGSTSTKVALFSLDKTPPHEWVPLAYQNIELKRTMLDSSSTLLSQVPWRIQSVLDFLQSHSISTID